jgi:hypothetical protein
VLALAALAAAAALVASRLPPGAVGAAFFAGLGLVLAVWPEVNSLAVIGPHPDGGGRFYGVTNQVETLLLAAALAGAAALGPRWLVPFGALALVVVGASRTGADGGGALVLAVGLLVLAFRLRGLALTPRRLAVVAGAAVALALGLVAIDAALGGSSHVTRAVGGGPGSLAGDLAHRLHVSYAGATNSWGAGLTFLVGVAGLAVLATRRPRLAAVDACLLALAVSFLVNDTPTDVAAFGALGCWSLRVWERGRSL